MNRICRRLLLCVGDSWDFNLPLWTNDQQTIDDTINSGYNINSLRIIVSETWLKMMVSLAAPPHLTACNLKTVFRTVSKATLHWHGSAVETFLIIFAGTPTLSIIFNRLFNLPVLNVLLVPHRGQRVREKFHSFMCPSSVHYLYVHSIIRLSVLCLVGSCVY